MSYEEIAIWIDTKARLEIISHFYTFKETVFVSVISRDNVKNFLLIKKKWRKCRILKLFESEK